MGRPPSSASTTLQAFERGLEVARRVLADLFRRGGIDTVQECGTGRASAARCNQVLAQGELVIRIVRAPSGARRVRRVRLLVPGYEDPERERW